MRPGGMCLGRSGSGSPTNMPSQNESAPHDAGSSNETTEFVNQGLLLWNQSRQEWTGNKKATRQTQFLLLLKSRTRPCMARKPWLCCLSSGKGNHQLLKTSKPFPKPVPLGEMVDVLVDVWQEEGMHEMA